MLRTVTPQWLSTFSEAVANHNGTLLAASIKNAKDCIQFDEIFRTLNNNNRISDTRSDTTSSAGALAVQAVTSTKDAVCRAILSRYGKDALTEENCKYIESVVRLIGAFVAVGIAKAAFYRKEGISSDREKSEGGRSDPSDNNGTTNNQNTPEKDSLISSFLLKGLLFAFTPFHEVHLRPRDPVTYRGFPGWDTAALIAYLQLLRKVAEDSYSFNNNSRDKATTVSPSSSFSSLGNGDATSSVIIGDLVRSWRKMFNVLQSVDSDVTNDHHSRKRGALYVVNSLIAILFAHENLHQVRVILQSIEANERLAEDRGMPMKSVIRPSSHMTSTLVEYKYYQGRIKLYSNDFNAAYSYLFEAYKLLPPPGKAHNFEQKLNKLHVHLYLVAASILKGSLPPEKFLKWDPVSYVIFKPLLYSIQSGSPAAYTLVIDIFANPLRKRGLYLTLQQAHIYCYLFLLQRVHAAISSSASNNYNNTNAINCDSSMIKIDLLVKALAVTNAQCCYPYNENESGGVLRMIMKGDEGESGKDRKGGVEVQGLTAVEVLGCGDEEVVAARIKLAKQMKVEIDGDLEIDDMILWMAKLISRRLVMGYISYEHRTLVLSKKNPFPTLSTVQG